MQQFWLKFGIALSIIKLCICIFVHNGKPCRDNCKDEIQVIVHKEMGIFSKKILLCNIKRKPPSNLQIYLNYFSTWRIVNETRTLSDSVLCVCETIKFNLQ
jgi:hypothetical protein